ncbi:hypothetical protein V1264_002906 [Littorina saxatilis]|uniref:Uncharacterized protein n=1 Tax=Littorina saxatilis TaxID=31220 RepID=A0AAN9G7Q0_9CAEN
MNFYLSTVEPFTVNSSFPSIVGINLILLTVCDPRVLTFPRWRIVLLTRRSNLKRVLELVIQYGSDLDLSDDDSGDDILDSGDEFVPMDDHLGDDSGNESVDHDIVYDEPMT